MFNDDQNPVRKSVALVMRQAKDVAIDRLKIEELADRLAKEGFAPPEWTEEFPRGDEKTLANYLFILDTLNFCFWPRRGVKWHILYWRKKYGGYFGLAYALKRFFEEFPERANFAYFSHISFPEFQHMMRGRGTLLFMKRRWQMLRGLAQVLEKKYHGDAREFVLGAHEDAHTLVQKIIRELPGFDDYAFYNGKKIYLLKRAQILVGDIWGAFRGRGIGTIKNISYLTAFPDYKLPQILQYWEVLQYSPKLLQKIKKRRMINPGSPEEIEIRAATVCAVEYLTEALERRGVAVQPFQVDWFLWNTSKRIELPYPHHLTPTIFY